MAQLTRSCQLLKELPRDYSYNFNFDRYFMTTELLVLIESTLENVHVQFGGRCYLAIIVLLSAFSVLSPFSRDSQRTSYHLVLPWELGFDA